MKKFLTMILASCILGTSLIGCSQKPAANPISKEKALELASAHTQMMLEGNYQGVEEAFTPAVKASVNAEKLKMAWETTVANAGQYKEIYSVESVIQESTVSVITILSYEQTGLKLTINYNSEGKIEGLWLNVAQIDVPLTETETFKEEKIEVGEYKLTGILTTPKNVQDYPIVVMVQGSGSSDYNETIGKAGNKPFEEIAHALAQQGIGTIRYNKRFFQKPELATADVTVWDEYMVDVYSAIHYASETLGKEVFVLGHSLGGMSAPKIAAESPKVKGIVMMAGTTRGLEDVILDQNRLAIQQMDTTETQKKALLKQVQQGVDAVKKLKEGDTSAPLGISAAYWLSLKELDAQTNLKNLQIPVLILQGKADFQVSFETDFQKMQADFGQKENITFLSYENLNHLFMPQTLNGAFDIAEYDAPNHVSTQVTQDIANWILQNK